MEIRKLRYFHVLSEELNFNAAAKKLYITQPTLSQQIRILEMELGVQLFVRNKSGVRLTKEGKMLLPAVKEILNKSSELEDIAARISSSDVGKGKITIGMDSRETQWDRFGVTDAITEMTLEYPLLDIRIEMLPFESINTAFKTGKVDVAFFSIMEKDFSLTRREYKILKEEEYCLGVGQAFVEKYDIKDIGMVVERLPVILLEDDLRVKQYVTDIFKNSGLGPKYEMVDSIESLKLYSVACMGAGLLPDGLFNPGDKLIPFKMETMRAKSFFAAFYEKSRENIWVNELLERVGKRYKKGFSS